MDPTGRSPHEIAILAFTVGPMVLGLVFFYVWFIHFWVRHRSMSGTIRALFETAALERRRLDLKARHFAASESGDRENAQNIDEEVVKLDKRLEFLRAKLAT